MRVLQALAGAEQGGAEMHFVRLCLALARAGIEQRVLIRPHDSRVAALREGGIPTLEVPFRRWWDRATPRAFRRQVDEFRPHVVLTYMSRASDICRRARRETDDFVHVARLGGYYDLKYYRGCDHLVGITPDLVEYFVAHGWPRERCHFIPNFVEDRPAAPAERAALETPAGAPVVFALGRLHPNKAFDTLIDAMAAVPGAYLWLAGEGPARADLERQAARLGVAPRVRFLGWRDDPGPLFTAADVFVVPSRHEPLGSVLLEGWMHGVPMVAAASQGPRFLLSHEETALLVPVDDPAAMAAAVRRLLEDRALAAELAARGRAAFEAGYTEEAVVARYLDLFQRVAG